MIDHARMVTLGDVARYHAEVRPGVVAMAFEGRQTSFASFDAHTNQVAAALIAAGVRPGQRIAYLGKNSDHFFELLIGAARAGVVIAPVNWRLAGPEVAYIVHDSEAPMLFVGPEFTGLAQRLAEDLPLVK